MGLLSFIPKPYLILIVAIALAASHGSAFYYGWKYRDNSAKAELLKEAQALNKEIVSLQQRARKAEAAHAMALQSVSTSYQEKLNEVKRDKDKFVADVRRGAIRLRIPTSVQASRSSATTTGASACRCDVQAGTELPSAVVEFLYSEASRADEIVEQLTACQAVVIEDRKIGQAPERR